MRGHQATDTQIGAILRCIRLGVQSLDVIARQCDLSPKTVRLIVLDQFRQRLESEHLAAQLENLTDQ